MIALLVHNYAFAPCNHASGALTRTLDGHEDGSIELLERRLREFFDAYQRLVDWTNRVVFLFSFPLSRDQEYNTWQEKHKLFHQELSKLIAGDDFSDLRRKLRGQWHEIVG
jgi:hypothetical protein